jgi:hypothetical protein
MALFDRKKKKSKEVMSISETDMTTLVGGVVEALQAGGMIPKKEEKKEEPKKEGMSKAELTVFSTHCSDLGATQLFKECSEANMTFGESMNLLMTKTKELAKELESENTELKSDFNDFNDSGSSNEEHKQQGKYASTMEGIPALVAELSIKPSEAKKILMERQPELFENPYYQEGVM